MRAGRRNESITADLALADFLNNEGHRLYGPMFDLASRDREMALQSTAGVPAARRERLKSEDLKWLSKRMAFKRVGAGLDFGCGTGRLLEFLSTKCRRLVAADGSKNMLRWAAQAPAAGKISFVHTDGIQLPSGPRSFDFIVCWRVLQHVARDHAARILIQLREVMKNNGRLFFAVPDSRFPDMTIFSRARSGDRSSLLPCDERRFSEEEVRFFLIKAGFRILSLDAATTDFRVVASPSRRGS